jgi:hypothetical protein
MSQASMDPYKLLKIHVGALDIKTPGIFDVGTDLEVRIRESLKQTWRSWHLPVRLHCPTFRKFCKTFAREPALM